MCKFFLSVAFVASFVCTTIATAQDIRWDSTSSITSVDIHYTGWNVEAAIMMDCTHQDGGHVIILNDGVFFHLMDYALRHLEPTKERARPDVRIRALIHYVDRLDDVLCVGNNQTMYLNDKPVLYSKPLERLLRSALPASYYETIDSIFQADKQ